MIDLSRVRTALAFFAHPDDETLAAGATISKLTTLGARVHVALPATGIHSRRLRIDEDRRGTQLVELRDHCDRAMAVLGVQSGDIRLGEFPDNEMDRHPRLELVHWLEAVIADTNPDLILTHHRYCTNIDHQYCHEAVAVATRPGLNNHIAVLCGEVPSSTGHLRPAQWEPNLYVKVTEEQLAAKIEAMETYKGEARPDPHPRSKEVLRALAKVRGSEAGFYFAEAFMLSRSFA